jgi:hypothetical protein
MKYYRNFLTIALPLHDDCKITFDDFNAEFFRGFHPDNQDILAEQVFNINPRHPANKPFNVPDVLLAAWQYFAIDRFHKPLQCHVCNKLRGHSRTHHDDPKKLIQRLFGNKHSPKPTAHNDDSDLEQEEDSAADIPKCPTYETHNVHFRESGSAKAQPKEDDDPIALVTKLKSLSVSEPSYLVLYSQCQECFPNMAQHLPKPNLFATKIPSAMAMVAYQSPPVPACQPWAQHNPAPSTMSPAVAASDKDNFCSDRNGTQSQGCMFCGMLGHRIHGCPAAKEYFDTGCVKIIGNRLLLPTGEPILNNGCRLGLKVSLDAWLAANAPPSSVTTTPTPQRDPPPHTMSYSFEILPEPTIPTGAYITEEAEVDSGNDDNTYMSELYDMYEVFATRKKDPKPFKVPVSAPTSPPTLPPVLAVPPVSSTSTGCAPQYRYQASAEDQALTKELLEWILKGTLDKITPAHILAASPPVCKELVECLKPRHVETASFEPADDNNPDPVSVLELAAKCKAEYSLPLQEIDVLVNSCKTEAGMLDQGSQIVVICEDLASEVGA